MGDLSDSSLGTTLPDLWTVDFASGPDGICYADKEFLDGLHSQDHVTFERVFDRINRVTAWDIDSVFRSHYLKPIDNGLVELRLSVGSEVRFLGFVSYDAPSPILYIVCGFRKKSQAIPDRHIRHALERKQLIESIRGPTK